MSPSHAAIEHHRSEGEAPRSRWILVLLGFAVIAAILLFTEHRAHVLGVLIYLPLLLCPLMHVFMHGGHRGHGISGQPDRERSAS